MKIKKLAIIILMTTLIMLGSRVQATTGKINSETVRIRKEPNTTSTILDQLDHGDEVEILEQEDGWYKVKAKTDQGKITGYISEKLIDIEGEITSENQENSDNQEDTIIEESEETSVEIPAENPVEEPVETLQDTPGEVETDTQEITETVSVDIDKEKVEENKEYTIEQELSVKVLPLINSREKAKITGNVKVIEIINDWCRIENDIKTGWIRTNTLKNALPETEIPTQVEEQEQQGEEQQDQEIQTKEEETQENAETTINKIGYVNADGLRVRKGPSTDTEEIDSLKKNDEVQIIGQTGNWYKIDLDGEIGYISAKYISETKIPETTSRSGSTLKTEETNTTEQKQEETPKEEKTTSSENVQGTATTGSAVVEYAKQYLGYKYVSGGASPSKGFDCSGFTYYIYKNFGITLNRTSKDQIKNGVAVEKDNLQLGDIVIFNNDANTAIGHVGIYIGDGNFIHASNPSDGVKITTLLSGYYQKRYVGARRVV